MTCPHDQLIVYRTAGGTLDDSETTYARCRDCRELVVHEQPFGARGQGETRIATASERRMIEELIAEDEECVESSEGESRPFDINESPAYREQMEDAGRGHLLRG